MLTFLYKTQVNVQLTHDHLVEVNSKTYLSNGGSLTKLTFHSNFMS